MTGTVGDGSDLETFWPKVACGTGVLVLGGSSGAVEHDRAALLADHGAVALAMRWFGGVDQQPGPWEVPLEAFVGALDRLAVEVDRLAVIGTSLGAEAALCAAVRDQRVDAVVALAPSAHVWAGVDHNGQMTSHWTWQGAVVDYVPLDQHWTALAEPPAFRSWYSQSLETFADQAEAAAIPVERIVGQVVLVAGGDDQVWPSEPWAREITKRRKQHGLDATVVTHPEAGHRVVLPSEKPVQRGQSMQRGGNESADSELGAAAWPHIQDALRLQPEAIS